MPDMNAPLTRAEHLEFCKRIEAEHKRLADEDNRQNRRLDILEEQVKQNAALVTSVEKLALNMEIMAKEQQEQGKRLETLEARDGEMWRKVVGYIVTATGIWMPLWSTPQTLSISKRIFWQNRESVLCGSKWEGMMNVWM